MDNRLINLCMIVRNEADVIERCLASVKPHIDHWTIVDTGSLDDTPQLVLDALEGVPGMLYHRPWQNFGHNRTEALELARGTAMYHLIIDADEVLEDGDLLGVWAADQCDERNEPASVGTLEVTENGTSWESPRILLDAAAYRYEPEVHALPVSDLEVRSEQTPGGIRHFNDGGCKAGRNEWLVEHLEAKVHTDEDDARSWFYLAQTYRDMGRRDDAIHAYMVRAGLGGWEQECYVSLLEAGRLQNDPELLIRAWLLQPHRLEALYDASWRLRHEGNYRAAYTLTYEAALARPSAPEGQLFVQSWVWEWGLLFEHSIAAWRVGKYWESRTASLKVLGMGDEVPSAYRQAAERNLQLAEDEIELAAARR